MATGKPDPGTQGEGQHTSVEQSPYEKKVRELHEAGKIWKKEKQLQQLETFCQKMEECELPHAARMFILEHPVYSLEDLQDKDTELIDAAKAGLRLEFSVKCLEEFVQYCVEACHTYDYPPGGSSVAAGESASHCCTRKDETLPPRKRVSGESASNNPSQQTSIEAQEKRLSSGYYSAAPAPAPTPKPRRPSVTTSEPGVPAAAVAPPVHQAARPQAAKSEQAVQPQPQPQQNRKDQRHRKNFMQLFLFPEKSRKPSRTCSNT